MSMQINSTNLATLVLFLTIDATAGPQVCREASLTLQHSKTFGTLHWPGFASWKTSIRSESLSLGRRSVEDISFRSAQQITG